MKKLLIGGSPCFPKGYYVTTLNGYKDISKVRKGDYVLSHKNRYRRVIRVNRRVANLYTLENNGCMPIQTTAEHPFFARQKVFNYGQNSQVVSTFLTSPAWVPVKNLNTFYYCGMFASRPYLSFSDKEYLGVPNNDLTANDLYMIGQLLTGSPEISGIFGLYGIAVPSDHIGSVKELAVDLGFIDAKGDFQVPEFVFSLTPEKISAFLRGLFVHSYPKDGCLNVACLGKKFALGVQRLVNQTSDENGVGVIRKLTYLETFPIFEKYYPYYKNYQKKTLFPINENAYCVGMKHSFSADGLSSNHFFKSEIDASNDGIWFQVKNIKRNGEVSYVYNLEVEGDNSYILDNHIVHNCTYWSIAQSPDKREVAAEGIGWELFKNYLIAKDKFAPDFFLYENNKSAAQEIKDQISDELGVPLQYINSNLVSAQNRQRFYCHNFGDVPLPEDRAIRLFDILDSDDGEEPYFFQLPHGYNPGGVKTADKSPTLTSNASFQYNNLILVNIEKNKTLSKAVPLLVEKYGYLPNCFNAYNRSEIRDKSPTLSTGSMITSSCATLLFEKAKKYEKTILQTEDGQRYPVYLVKDGLITVNNIAYPTKLSDGYYALRRLRVSEAEKLQTLPVGYTSSLSESLAFKSIGNGWTAEVIIHLLSHGLKDVPRDEKLQVLSLYDGIGTGRYCLEKLGFTDVEYYAYEIDKNPILVATTNYPDIKECGDAFKVRNEGWVIGQ